MIGYINRIARLQREVDDLRDEITGGSDSTLADIETSLNAITLILNSIATAITVDGTTEYVLEGAGIDLTDDIVFYNDQGESGKIQFTSNATIKLSNETHFSEGLVFPYTGHDSSYNQEFEHGDYNFLDSTGVYGANKLVFEGDGKTTITTVKDCFVAGDFEPASGLLIDGDVIFRCGYTWKPDEWPGEFDGIDLPWQQSISSLMSCVFELNGEDKVALLKEQVDGLELSVEGLQTELGIDEGAEASLQERVAAIETQLAGDEGLIEGLEEGEEGILADIVEINAELKKQEAEIDTLAAYVALERDSEGNFNWSLTSDDDLEEKIENIKKNVQWLADWVYGNNDPTASRDDDRAPFRPLVELVKMIRIQNSTSGDGDGYQDAIMQMKGNVQFRGWQEDDGGDSGGYTEASAIVKFYQKVEFHDSGSDGHVYFQHGCQAYMRSQDDTTWEKIATRDWVDANHGSGSTLAGYFTFYTDGDNIPVVLMNNTGRLVVNNGSTRVNITTDGYMRASGTLDAEDNSTKVATTAWATTRFGIVDKFTYANDQLSVRTGDDGQGTDVYDTVVTSSALVPITTITDNLAYSNYQLSFVTGVDGLGANVYDTVVTSSDLVPITSITGNLAYSNYQLSFITGVDGLGANVYDTVVTSSDLVPITSITGNLAYTNNQLSFKTGIDELGADVYDTVVTSSELASQLAPITNITDKIVYEAISLDGGGIDHTLFVYNGVDEFGETVYDILATEQYVTTQLNNLAVITPILGSGDSVKFDNSIFYIKNSAGDYEAAATRPWVETRIETIETVTGRFDYDETEDLVTCNHDLEVSGELTIGGDEVATETWITNQGYATQAWTNQQNFATLAGYFTFYTDGDNIPVVLMNNTGRLVVNNGTTNINITTDGYMRASGILDPDDNSTKVATTAWVNTRIGTIETVTGRFDYDETEDLVTCNHNLEVTGGLTTGGDEVATETWVANQGYATQTWVENKGYATTTDIGLAGYATQTWVENKEYATETWVEDKDYATETYVNDLIPRYSTSKFSRYVDASGLDRGTEGINASTTLGATTIVQGRSAMYFGDGNGFLSFPFNQAFLLESVTIAFWVNLNSTWQGTYSLLNLETHTGDRLYISTNNVLNEILIHLRYNSAGRFECTLTLTADTWTHIALCLGPDGRQVYMNGNSITPFNLNTDPDVTLASFTGDLSTSIGYEAEGVYLNEFIFFHWILTHEEVMQWFALGDTNAIETWVEDQGYATETWVENKGYSTVDYVDGLVNELDGQVDEIKTLTEDVVYNDSVVAVFDSDVVAVQDETITSVNETVFMPVLTFQHDTPHTLKFTIPISIDREYSSSATGIEEPPDTRLAFKNKILRIYYSISRTSDGVVIESGNSVDNPGRISFHDCGEVESICDFNHTGPHSVGFFMTNAIIKSNVQPGTEYTLHMAIRYTDKKGAWYPENEFVDDPTIVYDGIYAQFITDYTLSWVLNTTTVSSYHTIGTLDIDYQYTPATHESPSWEKRSVIPNTTKVVTVNQLYAGETDVGETLTTLTSTIAALTDRVAELERLLQFCSLDLGSPDVFKFDVRVQFDKDIFGKEYAYINNDLWAGEVNQGGFPNPW